jgi:hypothetical protein
VATVERMHSNTKPVKPVTNMVTARIAMALCELRLEMVPGVMEVP